MHNNQYYIDQFKSLVKPWNYRVANRTWYRPRYHWRIAFDFADHENRRPSFLSPNWRSMIDLFSKNGWNYRFRSEMLSAVFTNETALLDCILSTAEYRDKLQEVEYAGVNYLNEFEKYNGIDAITDVKFVKRKPEHCYLVQFDKFEWRKDDPVKQAITEYILANQTEYHFTGYDRTVINRLSGLSPTSTYYPQQSIHNGFRLYAKSPDDIIMLHMIAPGKITKIIKLMEKKVENIIG